MATPRSRRVIGGISAILSLVGLVGYGRAAVSGEAIPIVWPALCLVGGAALLWSQSGRAVVTTKWLVLSALLVSALSLTSAVAWPVQRWLHQRTEAEFRAVEADVSALEGREAAMVRELMTDFDALETNDARSDFLARLLTDDTPYGVRLSRRMLAETDNPHLVVGLLVVLREQTGLALEADAIDFAAAPVTEREPVLNALDEWLVDTPAAPL